MAFGFYLKDLGYKNWYIGCIPFANFWMKYQLGGCNFISLFIEAYCSLMFFYTGITYLTVTAFILHLFNDYKFATTMLNVTDPKVYTFVPFAKYYLMLKEAYNEGV